MSNQKKTFYERSVRARNGDYATTSELHNYWFTEGIDVERFEFMPTYSVILTPHITYNDIFKEVDAEKFNQEPNIYKKCELEIISSEDAVCKTLQDNMVIKIHGRVNCGQAYSGDIVYVKVFDNGDKAADGNYYGEVISFIERKRFKHIKNDYKPVLICQIDDRQSHLMVPIDKTVPKIKVLNGKIQKNLPELARSRVEIHAYDQHTKSLKFSRYHRINDGDKKDWLFIVVILKWKLTNIYPLGAIIDVSHCSKNIKDTLELISIENDLHYCYSANTVEETEELSEITEFDGYEDLTSLSVFTIDESGTTDLGCAYSIHTSEDKKLRVGVHVTDVSKTVKKGSSIDTDASDRGFTYIMGKDAQRNPMIPEPISENLSSFIINKKRCALSVFFDFDSCSVLYTGVVKKTVVRPIRNYAFEDIEDILESDSRFNDSEEIKQHIRNMKCLYELTQRLKQNRLGNSAFTIPVIIDLTSSCSPMDTVKARDIVNELTYITEIFVWKRLQDTFPDCAPAFQQIQMTNRIRKAKEIWYETHIDYVHITLALQGLEFSNGEIVSLDKASTPLMEQRAQENNSYVRKLLVPINKILHSDIYTNLVKKDFGEAAKIIRSDLLHPKQALALHTWISVGQKSQYICPKSISRRVSNSYVHFTSPLRRYCDIVIQRLLHAAIDNAPCPYKPREINVMCCRLNALLSKEETVRVQCKELVLAHYLRENPVVFSGFISDISDEEIGIFIPGLNQSLTKNLGIKFCDIDVCSQPEIELDNDMFTLTREEFKLNKVNVKWRKRIYCYLGDRCKRPAAADGDSFLKIYPHRNTVFVGYNEVWTELLDHVLRGSFADLNEICLRNIDNERLTDNLNSIASFNGSISDVNSEVSDHLITEHACSFQMSFHHGQIITLQLSSLAISGRLQPSPTILFITDNVKLCLPHVQNPIKTLHQYATKSALPHHVRYMNPKEYIDTWIPIIEMETTYRAVRSEDSVIINNIPIEFTQMHGEFFLDQDFCEQRDIDFGSFPSENDNTTNDVKTYIDVISSDYLCIMVEQPLDAKSKSTFGKHIGIHNSYYWQAHAIITKICKARTKSNNEWKNKIGVVFHLHESHEQNPLRFRKVEKCRLEIIQKSKEDRRMEIHLKRLDKASKLVKDIALRREINVHDRLHIQIANAVDDGGLDVDGIWPNNQEQCHAIRRSLKSRFKMIQGPPGTGKTYTGVKLLYLFNKFNTLMQQKTGEEKKKIIFCGPSNRSVDLVARLVIEKLKTDAPRIVRVYGSAYENLDFPIPGKATVSRRSLRGSTADAYLVENGVVLHHTIRQETKIYAEELKKFDDQFRADMEIAKIFANENSQGTKQIKTSLNDIKKYKILLKRAKQEELTHYDVIFCTTSYATNPNLLGACNGKVYQLIIDESGMCSEPGTIVPIIATKAKQVVLIGDHKQLRPIVTCNEAAKLGLEQSLFERYSTNNEVITMLKLQYRMHPAICSFPSKQFYNGELKTAHNIGTNYTPLRMWPSGSQFPHVFCHVDGKEESLTVKTEDGNEHSRSNTMEIEQVLKVYKHMIHVEKVPPETINIMSQYNAQCNAVRESLKEEKLPICTVATVVSSQGGEWDYVIFSLVRSVQKFKIPTQPTKGWCLQQLGFITDTNQINVALTRAKKGLVIIGNRNLLNCDEVWKKLLLDYEKEGCVVEGSVFPQNDG